MAWTCGIAVASLVGATLFELDDFMQILVLEKECQRQVARHVPIGLVHALLGEPAFILVSLHFFLFKAFEEFELRRVLLLLRLLDQLKIVRRLVFVDVQVQVHLLDEARAGFGGLQVVNELVLLGYELDPVRHGPFLRLEREHIVEKGRLQMVQVALLVGREFFEEALESFSCLSLGRLQSSAEVLCNTDLKDFIDEILVSKGLLLFRVLADDAHDLTETVRIVYGHLDAGQGLNLSQE